MYLERLILRNFRSFKEKEVTFSPQLNFIQGDNAQGKTNLLEAIVFLSTGRSFRTLNLKELMHHESGFFYIEAYFKKEGFSQCIKAHFDGSTRRLKINETSYNSFNPLLGVLPTVLYAPEHISLVTGPPAERRRFLDLHLSQLDPHYLYHISRYTGAMKQRNALLKQESESGIESWEEMMADSSVYLLQKRREAIHNFLPTMREALMQLSQGKDYLEMYYQSTFADSSSFLSQLQARRPKELSYGSSQIGPHRDDFVIMLNGQPARHFASEGQKRCVLASLRFSQWQTIRDLIGESPILSIDDFGAHLDSQRRLLLQRQMNDRGQVFLTAPHFEESEFSSTRPNSKFHFLESNKYEDYVCQS